jgi:oligogalacturonide transport system substrate-binding protein
MKISIKGMMVAVCGIMLFAQSVFAETATLRFCWWGGDSRHKPTLDAIKLFESANPGVSIKSEYMGWDGYTERLTTQISGSNEPDVMQINWAWIATMYSKKGDGFYDMFKAKKYLKLDEFGDSLNTGIINGKLNALPISYTARVYLWQKSVLDKAGVAMPATWDDLFADGRVFETKLGKDSYPIDGNLYDVILMAHAYIMQKYNKQWIDPKTSKVALNRAEALDFIAFYKKISATHSVIPLQMRLSIAGPEAATERQQEWITGKWAGNYTWDSSFVTRMSPVPKTVSWDVGPFISLKGAKNSGFFGRPSMMFAISKNSKKPELASRFINFMLTDPVAIKILGDSRGIPMSKIGYETLVKEGRLRPIDKKAVEQIRKTKIDLPSPFFEHARIQQLVREIFEQVSLGKISDDKAAERLTSETDKILDKIK